MENTIQIIDWVDKVINGKYFVLHLLPVLEQIEASHVAIYSDLEDKLKNYTNNLELATFLKKSELILLKTALSLNGNADALGELVDAIILQAEGVRILSKAMTFM